MFNIKIITPGATWMALIKPVNFAEAMAFVGRYVKSHGSYGFEVICD